MPDAEFGVKFGNSTSPHMTATRLEQWHERIFSSKWKVILIASIVFLPLLFINVRNSSDWGDDFAQYIHQAKNIVEGIPQSQTGYIFNKDYPVGGPRAYPVGFPLMLAPAWALFGNNLYAFTFTVALITWLLALIMTLFFMQYFRALTALILTGIFVYNPHILMFKQEVMSDLPFGLVLVLVTYLYTAPGKRTYLEAIVLALFIGFLISVKSVGLFFQLAICVDAIRIAYLRKRKRSTEKSPEFVTRGIMVAGGIGFYILLNMIFFRLPSGGGIRDYLYIFDGNNIVNFGPILMQNLSTYMEALRLIFILPIGNFSAIGLAGGSVAMAMFFFGLIRKFIQGFGFLEIMGFGYLAVLLIYPYNHGAYRFIYPFGFLFIYYMVLGLKGFNPGIQIPGLTKSIIAGSLMLLLFLPGIVINIRAQHFILEGPQQKASKEAFAWIKANTPADAVIAFAKPRALSLYAERSGFANLPEQDIAPMHAGFVNAGVNYFLESKTLSDESFRRYIRVSSDRLDHVWGNKEFDLYKIKDK